MWADHALVATLGAPGAPLQSDMMAPYRAAAGFTPQGTTVTRIVGWAAVSGAGTVATLGIRVGTFREDADDMDPTQFPFQDWMWLDTLQTLTDADRSGGPGYRPLDLHGQRKMDEIDTTLWLAVGTIAGAPGAIRVHFRILLKLP